MSFREPLSAVLITLNAAEHLAACLDSVRFADEILVVDSGSRDDTVQIAARYGARVVQNAWEGFGRQKRFAVTQARYDWVLCVDADEYLSTELIDDVVKVLAAPRHRAYAIPRRNFFLGKWLRHGEAYPDWCVRLFDRRVAQWSEVPVHERVIYSGSLGRLHGDLLHNSADSLTSYLAKQNRYTTLQAEELFAAGNRANIAQLVGSPLLRFIKFYFFRLGFLDGAAGFVHITMGCMNSFHKYAKLMALQRAGRP